MRDVLWKFIHEDGTFRVENPQQISGLYFPLVNEAGMMSSITPDLHGDIKTSQNTFLMQPVSIDDLHHIKSSRNFWVYLDQKGVWSATGVSSANFVIQSNPKNADKVSLQAGPLWHKVTRVNNYFGLQAEILNFIPTTGEKVELMLVTLTNISNKSVTFIPTAAIPIFARSAANLRDHRYVTSLLNRISLNQYGVVVKPTMSFDERGHQLNEISYVVMGCGEQGATPIGFFPTMGEFIGEGGNLEWPQTIIENLPPKTKPEATCQGKEALGGIRFAKTKLVPGKRISFVIIMGVASEQTDIQTWLKKFNSAAKIQNAWEENKQYWKEYLDRICFHTEDRDCNLWLRWVELQPVLRKIFGNSFLPDFDYGRGGRGWRDLWQDSLALILIHPRQVRQLLINNFGGIRIDGTNATIIGQSPGEFMADRNNITRVWMDHGIWPYFTLELYLHESGDFNILSEQITYFRDPQLRQAKVMDYTWTETYGKKLKTKNGLIYDGTIIEHILVQHLVSFFNVGQHNIIRLEDADWNDGLDMAKEYGESVTFTAQYAGNLLNITNLLEEFSFRTGIKELELAKELTLLLDTLDKPINYDISREKLERLEEYFDRVSPEISGEKTKISITSLCQDLRTKANWTFAHIRKKEWLTTKTGFSFYNGYYNNDKQQVEGDHKNGVRMTLTGQVFPIMSGLATEEQIEKIWKSALKYLQDDSLGGFRLNTDFGEQQLNFGRAFSFVYGEKENGAFFSHMAIMFAYALYRRGWTLEGFEVLQSIYQMCLDTRLSKIYPGIPEYFNYQGRGRYHYLTGSASWLILTLLTQVFGVRGEYGDLLLSPKLVEEQFGKQPELSVSTYFADKRIKVTYQKAKKEKISQLAIKEVLFNGEKIVVQKKSSTEVLITRDQFLKKATAPENQITVVFK